MIIISVENCTNTGAKGFVLPRVNNLLYTYCYYNVQFQSVQYFWENDLIYSNFQPRIGTRKLNGGAKFSEIKV